MTNLSLTLREAAQVYPDRPAVRLDSTVLTYAQLDDLSARRRLAARARPAAGRPGGHHAAQRAALPGLLLRRAARAARSSR